jgi:4-amino-4-deoxy-L-arabinose transferase-like glycosyltransferase
MRTVPVLVSRDRLFADLDAWTRRAWHRTAVLGLVFVLLTATCAPLSPLFDPDEGYYPATAAESLRSGRFWDLRFNDAPRWDKPILSYALIQAAFQVFGESAVAARVPSALQGAALIAIVSFLVARLTTARTGATCAVVVGTTLGVSIFSRVAHPEIALVLSTVTTELLLCVWLTAPDRRQRRLVAIGIGVSVAYGLLAKGPIAAVLPLLMLVTALPFIRVSGHSVLGGIEEAVLAASVAAALAAPWYLAMAARHGWPFLREAVWQQNVGRYATTMYGHRAGVFVLVLPTLVGLFPWTAGLPGAIGRLRRRSVTPRDVLRTCMLASAASALAFYSLSASKLASYGVEGVSPLAIMIGLMVDEDFDSPRLTVSTARRTAVVLGLCALVLVAAPFGAGYFFTTDRLLGSIRPPTTDLRALLAPVAIPLGCLAGAAALVVVTTDSPKRRIAAIAAVGALAPILIIISARPVLSVMYPWEAFGKAIAARPAPVWLPGRRAPSLTFYAGRPVRCGPDFETLETEVRREPAGWLVVTRDEWARMSAANALDGRASTVVGERGRMVLVWFGPVSRDHDNVGLLGDLRLRSKESANR